MVVGDCAALVVVGVVVVGGAVDDVVSSLGGNVVVMSRRVVSTGVGSLPPHAAAASANAKNSSVVREFPIVTQYRQPGISAVSIDSADVTGNVDFSVVSGV